MKFFRLMFLLSQVSIIVYSSDRLSLEGDLEDLRSSDEMELNEAEKAIRELILRFKRDQYEERFFPWTDYIRGGFNQGAAIYKNALGLDANASESQRIEALQQQEERLKSVATSSSVVKKPEEVGKRNLLSVVALVAVQREETERLDAEIKKLEAQSNV